MGTERTLYEILGVPTRATSREIRAAYRSKARQMHPDVARGRPTGGPSDGVDMADINRAWHVLSDAQRRRQYDLSLAEPVAASRAESAREPQPSPPQQFAPARFPWRGMLILAVAGITFVLVADATSSPPEPNRPDQLLQGGSCVRVDERSEVYEVSCSEAHDGVVRQLVALERPCPVGTQPHRDRQGMGIACVDPVVPADSAPGEVEQADEAG